MLDERNHIQPQLLDRVRMNLVELDAQLAAQNLCHRLDVEGGWYAILRVPARGSDEESGDRADCMTRTFWCSLDISTTSRATVISSSASLRLVQNLPKV